MKKYITRTIPVTSVTAVCVNVANREVKDIDVCVYGYTADDKEFEKCVDSFVSLETNGEFSVVSIGETSETHHELFRIPVDLFAVYGESKGVVNAEHCE